MGENNTKDENKKKQSILENPKEADVFYLTKDEYLKLYLFFVTYSLDNKKSLMSKKYIDFGWKNNRFRQKGLKSSLKKILDLKDNAYFKFVEKNTDISNSYQDMKLTAKKIDYENEHGALKLINKKKGNSSEYDNYMCLFDHIRNCLAHGRYILRINSNGEKMFILEDKNPYYTEKNKKDKKPDSYVDVSNNANTDSNTEIDGDINRYTARIVIKHDTIFKIISVIDKNNVLEKMENGVINDEAPTNIIPLEREQQMYGT